MRADNLRLDLAAIREENRRRARLIGLLRRIYWLGERPIGEMALGFAETLDAVPELEA
jgi:hypothetical protein